MLTLLPLLVSMVWMISNREEVVEVFHETTCSASCPALPAEQLRLQVIKAYLHRQLNSSIERRGAGGYYQIALLPRDFTKEDIKQEIQNEALVRTLTTNATVLTTQAQIDALSIETFSNNPSIAFYSLSRRKAQIIPTRSIQTTTLADIEEFLSRRNNQRWRDAEEYWSNRDTQRGRVRLDPLTWWELQRGYGRHFFWVTNYAFLDLGCCDGLGDESKNGSSPHKSKKESLLNLKSDNRYFMFVSNRGAILDRYPDD